MLTQQDARIVHDIALLVDEIVSLCRQREGIDWPADEELTFQAHLAQLSVAQVSVHVQVRELLVTPAPVEVNRQELTRLLSKADTLRSPLAYSVNSSSTLRLVADAREVLSRFYDAMGGGSREW